MKIRPSIETGLSATADRLNPGSGADAPKHAKNLLMTIDGTQEDFNARFGSQELQLVVPVVVEKKHPDGDPVTISKPHDGVLIVYPDDILFIRAMGFGAVEIKAHRKSDVAAESITTVLDGAEVPGLRLATGKPVALAIAQSKHPGNPAEQAAVRDEAFRLLTS